MKLLVRNLAKTTTEEKLQTLFTQFGAVQSCNLVMDKETGKSKGFGFIEMPKPGEAKAAIKQLNGYKLAGNNIRVKKAEDKAEKTEVVIETTKAATKKLAKETAKKPTKEASEVKIPEELKDNKDNALNLYGKVKESDDQY
jgi:RNA recognition motif-containing protein